MGCFVKLRIGVLSFLPLRLLVAAMLAPLADDHFSRLIEAMHLKDVLVSEIYKEQFTNRNDLVPVGDSFPMQFDAEDNLCSVQEVCSG